MKFEIEHKYLVRKELWDLLEKPEGILVKQGYLLTGPDKTIRIRIKGSHGFLTIKGPVADATRLEYEYPIPVEDAGEILSEFTLQQIEKIRYDIWFEGKRWEVDQFLGENEGLLVAEIELQDKDDNYEKPVWLGKNVTGDPRYYNSYLTSHPYKSWKQA